MFSIFVLQWFHLCLLAVVLLLLPLLLIIRRSISNKSKLPPSPPKLPFIGNLHQLGSLPHRSLHALSDKHGPLMLLQLGQVPTLVVSSPEFAKEIMKTHDTIFASRPSLKAARILLPGDLAFAPYGEHWRQLRKLCVVHLLGPKCVQSFQVVREEEVTSMINKISMACSSSREIDLSEALNSFVNNILCRVVLGKSFKGDGKHNIYRKLTEGNSTLLGEICIGDYFPSIGWIDVFFGFGARVRRHTEVWKTLLGEVIDEHAKLMEGKDDLPENADFVDVLLHLQKDPSTGLNLNRELIRVILMVISILLRGSNDLAFAPYGPYWRQVRKVCVSHLLSSRMVQSYQRVRNEEVALMIKKISQISSPVNMSEVLNSFANDVICRVVSGKFSKEGRRNEVFREMIEETSLLVGGFNVADNFPNLAWLDVFFGMNARNKRNSNRWHDVLEEVIKEHVDGSKDDDHEDKIPDFVDILLSLQKDSHADFFLEKENIKALILDMFFAGTDTSYITLEWSMAELLRNPGVMKKLQDEVRGVASGKNMITEEDLSKMRYLKAVIKEVLRLHPAAPLSVPRESMNNCVINGYEIPSKTRVIINVWAIGRDPQFWKEPEEFQPERFIDNPVDFKGTDFQFIPFGAGRRICPGMNFAVSNTELALANLVHCFDWELPDGMRGEDLNMDDVPGITSRRKERLQLVAKLHYI